MYNCEFCNNQYKTKSSLNYHKKSTKKCLLLRNNIDMLEAFKCTTCDFKTALKLSFNSHKCKSKNITKNIKDSEEKINKLEYELKISLEKNKELEFNLKSIEEKNKELEYDLKSIEEKNKELEYDLKSMSEKNNYLIDNN